jgi:hypothetical protein
MITMENDLLQYVDVSLLVLVAVIYGLGMFLKTLPSVNDWLIPFILLGASIVLTIAYTGFILELGINGKVVVNGIIQGILVASVAVFGNQIIKQFGKKE